LQDIIIKPDINFLRKPKPFAFIEFINYDDAKDAKNDMDRRDFHGRQIDVVFAQERRKSSDQMRQRDGPPVGPFFRTPIRLPCLIIE
jgi:FUS-interacting serine-arginine-rich protein 1